MLGAAFYSLARLVAERASGAAVAVLFRNSRDARVRVQGGLRIPTAGLYRLLVLIFISL